MAVKKGASPAGQAAASAAAAEGTKDGDDGVVSSSGGRLDESVLAWFRKRNGDTLQGALAFVPWVLQQAYFDDQLQEGQIVVHRGRGVIVFSSASGFTKLTERLAKRSNGAELLSQCLTQFFTPLVDLLNDYHGDVIKFSGDALTVYFPDVDDTKSPKYNRIVPPHGTYGLPDLGPMATAVLRASACCIEIHKRLNMFDTGVDGVCLCLRIGIGCGQVAILQVGGEVPPETHVRRYEYIIAGPPLEQISFAEPLAKNGQTCLSPQAWDYVKDCVIEGSPLEDRPDFHLLLRMDESKYTFPPIKHAAQENDNRLEQQVRLSELNIIRQYIPHSVFKQIECGTLTYVNEMRHISSIFINGQGLDVMSEKGPNKAQDLMSSIQRACYAHEGTLNKFLIDEKGMLFLLVFGLPPLVHTDDPTRAVLSCFDMVKVFKGLELTGRFGLTTSQSYCGVCGSARRMEYTVLGDDINLAARLMGIAPRHGIVCDENTKDRVTGEIVLNALAPIMVKERLYAIFQPVRKEDPLQIGYTGDGNVRFPWQEAGGGSSGQQLNVQQLCSVKGWVGIAKVNEVLGGVFEKAMHESETLITKGPVKASAPSGSPFQDGGVVVLAGPTGVGKVELAEHIVVYTANRFQCMPIFGTMGPRPADSIRLATELLRSTLGVFRFFQPNLPADDFQLLQHVVPQNLHGNIPHLRNALNSPGNLQGNIPQILDASLEVVMGLLLTLIKQTAINVILQFEVGTTLFPKTYEKDQTIFWQTVQKLAGLVQKERQTKSGNKPFVMTILCTNVDTDAARNNPAILLAEQTNTVLDLKGLAEDAIIEYLSSYIGVTEDMVPKALKEFVSKVTLGNPLYIRETVDEMQENSYIAVNRGANGQARSLDIKDIDKINVAAWQHTSMVGGTVCLLESLDPLESAVLKMSTCFLGPFALPDLAASTCSQWADATHFDFLRLYNRIQLLVKKRIIEVVDTPLGDSDREKNSGQTQRFQTRNLVIRAVGSSMVLEKQRKSVKRQALVDRALSRELPARLEVLAQKRSAQHIPWYYEQAFRRM